MKKIYLSALVCSVCCFFYSANAQVSVQKQKEKPKVIRCYTVENTNEARKANSNIVSDSQFEAWLKKLIDERKNENGRIAITNYTLPVIFHIIHNGEPEGTGTNISNALILSQVNQLNRDFGNNSNSTYGVASNTGIKFALAQKDPLNNNLPSPGVNRVNRNTMGWTASPWSSTYINSNIKPATIWDPTKYINIWVAPIDGGILGYATFPGMSGLNGLNNAETNTSAGVVVLPTTVGGISNPSSSCGGSDPYNLGRTMTHEMGHFFGLRHIWGDAQPNCGNDFCNDTPASNEPNYGAPSHPKPNICGTPDEMFENYMDYTDDRIMHTFTADQAARIQTVMLNSPRRKELPMSTAGLVSAAGNRISFNSCNNTLFVSERGTNGVFPWFRDVNVLLNIDGSATGNATLTINAGGTATNTVDYQVMNSPINIVNGDEFKIVTIRIWDDGNVENDETIVLSYTISGTGVVAGTTGQTFTITIVDDDAVRPAETQVQLLSENFGVAGGTFPSGWTPLIGTGSPNSFTISTNGTAGGTGQCAHITSNTTTRPDMYNQTANGLAVLRTPLIDAGGVSNLVIQYKYRVAGEIFGSDFYDFGMTTTSSQASPTTFVQVPGTALLASNTVIQGTVNSPMGAAFNNSKFHIGFWWENDNSFGTNPGLNIDDVLLVGDGTKIETAAATNNTFNVPAGATPTNYKSRQNGKVIAIINNASAAVSAVTASIEEAGTDRPTISTNTGTYFRTRKVVKISPASPNTTTTYQATIFFTAAEMAAWGGTAPNLRFLKVDDGVSFSSTINGGNGVIVIPTSVNDRLSTEGYISYTGNFTGFSKFVMVEASTILPVTLLDFNGSLVNNAVKLKWATTAEFNNKGFEIQRSTDGVNFTSIGWVNGQNGSQINNYNFEDAALVRGNKYYYKLKQIDVDGRFVYSQVVSFSYNAGITISLYPNPVKDKLVIQSTLNSRKVNIVITDASGRTMYKNYTAINNNLEISTTSWSAGVYNVQIQNGNSPMIYKIVKE